MPRGDNATPTLTGFFSPEAQLLLSLIGVYLGTCAESKTSQKETLKVCALRGKKRAYPINCLQKKERRKPPCSRICSKTPQALFHLLSQEPEPQPPPEGRRGFVVRGNSLPLAGPQLSPV